MTLKSNPIYLFILFLTACLSSCSSESGDALWHQVEQQGMVVSVTASGELRAVKDIKVNAPFELRGIGIYNCKIQDIVAEGSRVKKGDVIATLDKTELMNNLSDASISLRKAESEFLNARLDTTLNLREARDALKNQLYTIEEQKLVFEQSKFEVPSIQRQAELNYTKAKDAYEQKVKNYATKKSQANAKMNIAASDLASARGKMQKLQGVVDKMNIVAPEDGMVIYAKDWNGRKRTAGSSFNIWNPTVASLPDLRYMESITYVNEVDVQKVRKDQTVVIKIDAMEETTLKGKVKSVANIGEQRGGSSAKVFEVLVSIEGIDTNLRPAMSTQNMIESAVLEETIVMPLECLHVEDSTTFVFLNRSSSTVKKVVETGKSNDTHIQVLTGLKEGDKVSLNTPENAEELKLVQ